MGVSGLSKVLRLHSRRLQLSCSSGSECCYIDEVLHFGSVPLHAIIDGPSLVHWRYQILLSKTLENGGAVSRLDAQPTYLELISDVENFLETLERSNFTVHALYFDGELPVYKRDVRLERLNNAAHKLMKLRAAYPNGIKIRNGMSKRPDNLVGRPSNDGDMPLCFMVPAVVEYLRNSKKWRNRTYIVPGEADAFIAADARESLPEQQGFKCVLSNDSDMAISDLDEALLAGLETVIEQPCSCGQGTASAISCFHQKPFLEALAAPLVDIYEIRLRWARAIFRCMQLQDMPNLLESYRRDLKEPIVLDHDLRNFLDEHAAEVSLNKRANFPPWQQNMDVRLGELAQNLKSFTVSEFPAHIYMPPLLEDAERTSAWIPSRFIRTLAYRALSRRLNAEQNNLCEFVRSGDHTFYASVTLGQVSARQDRDELLRLSKEAKALFSGKWPTHLVDQSKGAVDLGRMWQLFASMKAYDWYLSTGKQPPTTAEIGIALGRHYESQPSVLTLSWCAIHFIAIVHAFLYSLRILQQVSRVPYPEGECSEDNVQKIVESFIELQELPPLESLVHLPREPCRGWTKIDGRFTDFVKSLQPRQAHREDVPSVEDGARVKRLERAVMSNNPFDLLLAD